MVRNVSKKNCHVKVVNKRGYSYVDPKSGKRIRVGPYRRRISKFPNPYFTFRIVNGKKRLVKITKKNGKICEEIVEGYRLTKQKERKNYQPEPVFPSKSQYTPAQLRYRKRLKEFRLNANEERIEAINEYARELREKRRHGKRKTEKTKEKYDLMDLEKQNEYAEMTGKNALTRGEPTKAYAKWMEKDAEIDEIAGKLNYGNTNNKLYEIRDSFNALTVSEDDFKRIMLKVYNQTHKNKIKTYTKDFEEFCNHKFYDIIERSIKSEENRLREANKDLGKSKESKKAYKTSELRLNNIKKQMESRGYYDFNANEIRSKMEHLEDDEIITDLIEELHHGGSDLGAGEVDYSRSDEIEAQNLEALWEYYEGRGREMRSPDAKIDDLHEWVVARNKAIEILKRIKDPNKRIELATKAEKKFNALAQVDWGVSTSQFAEIRVKSKKETKQKEEKLTSKSSTKTIVSYINKYNAKSGNAYYVPFISNQLPKTRSYGELSEKQKEIIWRELSEENIIGKTAEKENDNFAKKYYPHLNYSFEKKRPTELPASSWEEFNEASNVKIFGKERILHDLKKIKELEQKILKEGYNEEYPVTIEYDYGKRSISMGNHRIQAIRNLMARGQLPSTYQIPVMNIVNNQKLREKLFREMRKKRKSVKKHSERKGGGVKGNRKINSVRSPVQSNLTIDKSFIIKIEK